MHAMAGTGRVIAGRYRLKEPIGRGAMGTVWRAWDEILDREVAVKELRISESLDPDERAKAYQRTHREARTAARLSHPGVVTVFDVAEEDGRPWIIMELVAARSLDQIISVDGPMPPHHAADAGRQLLAAVATAHAAGVLHRDVKPSNVLIADSGRAVLTDFGIATFQGDPKLTQTGMVMGSPGFTAPERIQGNPATPASDLWSLGATLYAAVEGHGPFDRAGGAITTMSAIINTDPPSAPPAAGLGPVIDALLRRNPADRPDAATAARMLGSVGPLPDGTPNRSAFTLIPPRRPEPASRGAPVPAERGTPAPAERGTPEPRTPAEPAPEVRAASPTSADLPSQADQTIPVEPPSARRAVSEPGPDRPGEPAGTEDRPPSPASFFGSPGTPAPDGIAAPPAQRDGNAGSWNIGPAGNAVLPAGGRPRDASTPPVSAGQPWEAAPGSSADRSWNAAPVGSAGPWGSAQAKAAGPVPGTSAAWGAAPATGPAPAAPPRRRAAGRTALVVLGVLAVIAVVAAGLIILRHHRTQLSTASNQSGSGGAAAPGQGPVLAARGPAATGAPRAGFRTVQMPAATLGTTAGFTVAVPDTWTVHTRGLAMYAEAPGGLTFLQIDLSPHTKTNMLAEANYLAQLTRQQGRFPGYRDISISPADIRGGSGAAWEFTWRSSAGTIRALDLLYIASTPAGQQSYALYMSAPAATWSSHLGAFDEETHTFRPVP
jgi:eukaryotic-like serine/threonine-protein kinase